MPRRRSDPVVQIFDGYGNPAPLPPQIKRAPPPPPPKMPVRPGAHPECCGAIGAGNGGHEPHCEWRPRKPSDHPDLSRHPSARCFDHMSGEPEDKRFSAVAKAMRSEAWWHGRPVYMVPDDAAGEIDTDTP